MRDEATRGAAEVDGLRRRLTCRSIVALPPASHWAHSASRHRPLLHAALEAWPELDAGCGRYAVGSMPGHLWAVPNNLHFVLANWACPTMRARGPSTLLRYVRPAVAVAEVEHQVGEQRRR